MAVPAEQKKRVQTFLVSKGYDLGRGGPLGNGVDGDDGPRTWNALESHLGTLSNSTPIEIPKAVGGVLIDPVAFAKWAPSALPGTYEALESTAHKWGLKGLPLIHWLGQMYVESGGYSIMAESLNYSVESLKKVFGRSRISEADCNRLGRTATRKADQKTIANIVYGGQWGKTNLGNRLDHPNDGWDKRGSSFKQLTGEENIRESGYTAEQLRSDVQMSADAAAWYFCKKKPQCVQEALQDDVEGVTRAINGGLNGFEDRKLRTKQARNVVK